MKKCSVCSHELGRLEEKHSCLNGYLCDSCYLQAKVSEEALKNMSLNEVKNQIFHKENTPLNSDLMKSKTSTSWICSTCGTENKGSDDVCVKCAHCGTPTKRKVAVCIVDIAVLRIKLVNFE